MVLAELIAAVEPAVRGSLNAVRAFARTLLSQAPSREVDPEEGALPDSYGETRLVLLVVDPHLVHAYWEVAPDRLRKARHRAGSSARSVLRFHEAAGSFDANIDLGPRNWYVPLWSAGQSYYADLGLKDAEGNFFQLARSNIVVTPRALPVVEVEEPSMPVATAVKDADAEIAPPPPHRQQPLPPMPAQPPAPGVEAAPAVADPPCAVPTPAPPASAGRAPLTGNLPKPTDSAEILSGKLAELHAFRDWRPEPLKPPEALRDPGGPPADASHSDLVEMAEQRQIPGLSSPLPQERRPEP